MKILFIFLDGVGLGVDNAEINPFALWYTPHLQDILNGKRLLAKNAPLESSQATLISIDATLGVAGMPQSATGQAVLLTGKNVPALIGAHYGPKPNKPIIELVTNGNLFSMLIGRGKESSLLNAYPPRFFSSIINGRRILSVIPLAATSAGLRLKNNFDLIHGNSLSADFTGQGWHDHLGITDIPVMNPLQAGKQLAKLAHNLDFAFFEYWLSDYAGHHQNMNEAAQVVNQFDEVLDGLMQDWDPNTGLIIITSDHGNMEDLSTRRHTLNPVPLLVIGAPKLRKSFIKNIESMTDIAPAILETITGQDSQNQL
jgi:hypothetical protein